MSLRLDPDIEKRIAAEVDRRVREYRDGSGQAEPPVVSRLRAELERTRAELRAAKSLESPTRSQDEELQRAHALLAGITAGTGDLIAAEDGEFRYLFFNEAYRREFRRLWGRELEIGTSMVEALAPWPEEQAKARELWQRALAGEAFSVSMEFGPSKEERQVYDLRFNPVHDQQGRRIGAAHILRNVTEQVRMEEALRDSERRFKATFENAAVGMAHVGLDGKFIRFNHSLGRITGYAPEELAARTFQEITHPDDLAVDLAQAERLLAGEIASYSMEKRYFRKNGRFVWINLTVSLQRDENGEPEYFIAVIEDITDRKRNEEALRRSGAILEAFFEASPGILNLVDDEFRYLKTDRLTPTYFGLDRRTIVGRKVSELAPELAGEFGAMIRRVAATGEPVLNVEVKSPIPSRPGEMGSWRASCFPVPLEGGKRWVGVVGLEISDLKRAEAALEESRNQLQTILESAPVGLAVTDAAGAFIFRNRLSGEILGGAPTGDAYGPQSGYRILRPDGSPFAPDELPLPRALRGEASREVEMVIRSQAGREKTILAFAQPLVAARGGISGAVASLLDITERKQAEEQLRKTLESIGDGFFALDRDWRLIYVNAEAERLLGIRREELLGRNHWEVFPPALGTRLEAEFRRAAAGEVREFENYYEPWGRWFHNRCFPRAGGGMSVYFRDITDRKRAEEALRESEERFRTLADHISQFAWMANGEGWIFWYNRRWYEYTGTTLEEMKGWGWRRVHHPEHVDRVVAKISSCFATGEVWEDTFPLRGKDGGYRWFLSRAVPIRDEQGRVSRWFGTNTDVTELLQAEEELRQKDIRLTLALEAGGLAPWELDLESGRFSGSPQLYRLFGRQEEIGPRLPEQWEDLVAREDRARVRAAVEDGLARRGKFSVQFRTGGPAGGERWIEVNGDVLTDEQHQPARLVGVSADITERKRAEEALKESEALFRQLTEAMPQLVWMTRPDGYHVYFNQRWYEFTGTVPGETQGELWARLLHPDDHPRTLATWHESLRTGEPYSIEYRLKRGSDGSYHWFLGRAMPVRNAQGEITRWFGTCTDIQELKAAQEELARSNRDLEQFAYIASHDLQTPLRAITGFLDLLSRRYKGRLGPEADEFIAFAVQGAERMHQLINDVLAFSRVGSRGKPLEPVDSREPLHQALASLEREIRKSRAEITMGALPVVRADRDELAQLFQNLIGNALKYRRPDEPPRIQIGAREQAQGWEFWVGDNGIGLDQQFAERIFQIFQRLHPVGAYPGTGIGLAICRRIVERHGGRIWVESEPGRGATFFFTLPKV